MDVKRITPEFVDSLHENEIVVFHAVFGQGEGLQGCSYAIPTAGISLIEIKEAVDRFTQFAAKHPELYFLVTAIGYGLGMYRRQ